MPFPDYIPYQRKKPWLKVIVITITLLVVLAVGIMQIPRVNRAVYWRMKIISTYLDSLINPVGMLPTPVVNSQNVLITDLPTLTSEPRTETPPPLLTPMPTLIPTPTIVPTPLPPSVSLNSPPFDPIRDKEDYNNCGPATLAMALRYYNWKGDQYDISKVIKPNRNDSNVNVEEMVYFVRTQAGWLNAEFRVGGNMDTLRKYLSNGIPVIIEETYMTDREYRINDDRWSGHYLLLTGYDDAARQVTALDVILGPNQVINYDTLEEHWQSFNHVYILVFKPEQANLVQALMGVDADPITNRQNALAAAERETQTNPRNAFAWFDVGSNLVALDRYNEAAQAYDKARIIGLPMRMLRYQFGPFIAYFHAGRIDDLMTLTKYALDITPRASEEANLWRGWAFYRKGDKTAALTYFGNSLDVHPGYLDALHAIDYVTNN
jgi:tetratricopeptide (TPR) repeat protein